MPVRTQLPSSPISNTGTAVLLVAYFVLALWGNAVLGGRTAPTALIWPASGVGLALVLLRGTGVWPWIFVAALGSSLLTLGAVPVSVLLMKALSNAVTSVLVPVIAAWLIWRVAGETFAERAPPFVLSMVVGVPVAAFAAAVPLAVGELSAGVIAAREEFGFVGAWYSAGVADLMGMLVLTPPIWIWLRHPRGGQITGRQALELLLLMGAVGAVFAMPQAVQGRYLIVAAHLAIALRFPLKWSTAAVAFTSVIYLAIAAFGLRTQPLSEIYTLFLNNVAFVIIINLATYVTALLHLEVRARAEQLGELADHLGEAEQRERERIAKILHDELQQLLVAAKLALPASEASARSRERIDQSIEVARTLSAELHPRALDDRNFVAVLKWLAWRTRELTGLEVRVDADEGADPGSSGVRTFLFQAIRELLMNVVKHANTNAAWVRLRHTHGWLVVEVEDHGRGCDPDDFARLSRERRNQGAAALRQRVELLGGRFEISAERGCRITVSLPTLELRSGQ